VWCAGSNLSCSCHCKERSDEAIDWLKTSWDCFAFARNDKDLCVIPETAHWRSRSRKEGRGETIKAKNHLAASLAVSGILYLFFRSLSVSFWSFVGGTLIDLDHFYDYARHPERSPRGLLDLRHFFEVVEGCRLINVYVLLHSWELVALLLLVGWWLPMAGTVLIPLAFGMAVHLMLDTLANPTTIVGYSFLGRMRSGFSGMFFFKDRRPPR